VERQCCSTVNYLSNVINILVGMTPYPQNLGLNAITPNRKDSRSTFHTRRSVQSWIADLLVLLWYMHFRFVII